MTALGLESCSSEIKIRDFLFCFIFFSLNGSASYSVISNYNILREAYGGLDSALGIKREIENSF